MAKTVSAMFVCAGVIFVQDARSGGAARGDGPTSGHVQNVILITLDTLRADRLGAYGYHRPTSPNLDRFMAKGVRFAWAFSTASYTAPSHVSMMTGVYPSFTSVGLDNGRFFRLRGKAVTLAERCRDAGMRTGAVVSNPTLNRRLGLHQGFATYYDMQFSPKDRSYHPKNAAVTTDEALVLLDIIYDAPFFLWVHYQDPHGPYTPPPPAQLGPSTNPLPYGRGSVGSDALSKSVRHPPGVTLQDDLTLALGKDTSGYKAIPTYQVVGKERLLSQYSSRYDDEIRYLDSQLARLFARIDKYELLGNTIVIMTADHGEAFGEDGYYFAHSHSVGMDQVHVPLAMVGPAIKADVTLTTPVTNLDIFATVLDALGLSPGAPTPSRSLFTTLRTGREPAQKALYVESFGQRGVVLKGYLYRADRRPPDSPIWRISPTTNAFHKPLGTQILRLGGGQPPDAAATALLRAELDAFSLQAEEAIRQTFESLAGRSQRERTRAEWHGLMFWQDRLGYDFELEKVEPIPAPAVSDEEAAHRRAMIGLGYLTEDEDE